MRIHTLALAVVALATALAQPVPTYAESSPKTRPEAIPSPAKLALDALFSAAWDRDLTLDPLRATYFGDNRFDDRLPDISTAGIKARGDAARDFLAQLARIDRSQLAAEDQLSYDLFAWEYESRVASAPYKPYLYELRPRDGPQALSELTELLPFATERDYENWIGRLNGVGRYFQQYEALLAVGIREKRTQPRVIMERVLPQLKQQLASSPEGSPFYAPFKRIPESFGAADRERLAAAGLAAVRDVVLPAYARFEKFFREKYLPATRATVGIWDTPRGLDYYRNRALVHTTTKLTPDEIHAIGLREVARLRAEMQKVMDEVGFKGSLTEFFTYLRTDPKFYFQSSQALFEAYAAASKKIDPELVRLFGTLPRTPYGVRPIPSISAPNTTTAYYQGPALDGSRAGYYYVNLYRPEVRPKYEIEVLTIHEAVPGHHLQIALAQEQAGLPQFRRNAEFTAYVEGWALYSEGLGTELGMYKDPYSRFGYLTYDMWRAVRLVVDTGIHAKKWTRQQAIDYFKDNAAKTEADIVNEIDRYIAWPGQALAYKIGQLKIQELRRDATQTLGSRFDIRAFHDELLVSGAVPLDVLERRMRAWIAARAEATKR
jgi:uncharacterized protein (DUF885 family)